MVSINLEDGLQIPNAIFSNALKDSKWDNTTIINGNLAEAIKALKNKDGKDIIVYGGDSFVSSLIQHDLIDELCACKPCCIR